LESVEKLDVFENLQKGNTIRSSWRGSLPYTITIDALITDFIHPSSLSFSVTGDLSGKGLLSIMFKREFCYSFYLERLTHQTMDEAGSVFGQTGFH